MRGRQRGGVMSPTPAGRDRGNEGRPQRHGKRSEGRREDERGKNRMMGVPIKFHEDVGALKASLRVVRLNRRGAC